MCDYRHGEGSSYCCWIRRIATPLAICFMQASAPPELYLGLDPGKTGAVAIISRDLEVLVLEDLPIVDDRIDYLALYHLVAARHITAAALEQPLSYGMNAYTCLSIGTTWGLCLGAVLQANPARLLTPTASSWKKHSGLTADKAMSKATAQALFTGLPKRLRHDKAEALLLAHYALRVTTGTPNP